PGVPEAISKLNKAGYLVIIVTNQSGIGRGLVTEAAVAKVHEKLKADIAAGGGRIDDIFFCPHHPDEKCNCRKPEIGMGIAAFMKHHINPTQSCMIGDFDRDIEFGKRLGLKTYLVSEKMSFVDAVDDFLKN
ncbi:MAG: HAD-IIIA family hydrolase, partial [Candidatus Cloacimonetes bacterium]|nr:HAD-IIIA family hydrolase [Candidatus Cloacimonadota bacterium]